MVAIKSLAILLFAAAVAAVPLAGGNSANAVDDSVKCGSQGQTLYCCNDATSKKATGKFTSFLDGTKVRCNSVTSNVWAVDGVSGQSQCSAKSACCFSKTDQNGMVNLNIECIAIAGPN